MSTQLDLQVDQVLALTEKTIRYGFWRRGLYEDPDAVCRCLVNAINRAVWTLFGPIRSHEVEDSVFRKLSLACEMRPLGRTIVTFNDDVAKNHVEVADLVARAREIP